MADNGRGQIAGIFPDCHYSKEKTKIHRYLTITLLDRHF